MGAICGRSEGSRFHVLRLMPGDDLKKCLFDYVVSREMAAGLLVTCVGSLSRLVLRPAAVDRPLIRESPWEILSLSGSLCPTGLHLHMCVSDGDGNTLGGHLLDGNIIRTTAEIGIAEPMGLSFQRRPDPQTGFLELFLSGGE